MSTRSRFLPGALVALAALLAEPFALASPAPFTLEEILSAPFPSGLESAPSQGRIAWVVYESGTRNIWVAGPPEYAARAITSYARDDGQALGELRWTPDAEGIVFVRGGPPNAADESPNPTSDPAGAERALWFVSVSGSEPWRLDEGHSPAVSPRGDRIVYLKDDKVWSIPLRPIQDARPGQEGVPEPRQLFQARGRCRSPRWSPDGSRLAFVSDRGTNSYIGIYDLDEESLRYLDPSVDRDSDPAWSPDGDRIAFIRIPAYRRAFMFGPRRTGEPWSIRVADRSTGKGWEAWKAQPGPGSVFRGIAAESALVWTGDGRVVFPWEKDGWLHLYSVKASGGEALLLTPGEFEVQHVAPIPDGGGVVFSSNQEDVDRRHLWRLDAKAREPSRITAGAGIEWSPVVTSDGRAVAFLRSDGRRPAHAAITTGPGEPRALRTAPLPGGFPLERLVEPKQVVLSAADGLRVHGQLFLPPRTTEGKRHPAVLYMHGGSRRQMLLGWHYRQYYHNCYAMNQYLASRGYVVLSVNYRSGIGYGLEFREAEEFGATGASEFNDILGAGLYLRGRPDVDPNRIGLWGGSYGGYLTALGLARASDLFAAGVDLHGVHDWNVVIHHFRPEYDVHEQPEAARLAFESSPMASIEHWRSPVLLIHGDDDRNVPFSETVHLAEELRKQGVEFEQLIFPDEVHGFLTHRRWLEALQASADFFDRHLGAGE